MQCGCDCGEKYHGMGGCNRKVSGPSSDDHYCDCSWDPTLLERLRASAVPCQTHKRYLAKRKPRGACEDCWRMYIYIHPQR